MTSSIGAPLISTTSGGGAMLRCWCGRWGDVAEDPQRVGVTWLRLSGRPIGVYHLRHSREGVPPAERVDQPRHLVVFRIGADGVADILGFIHERMLRDRALRRLARQPDDPRFP